MSAIKVSGVQKVFVTKDQERVTALDGVDLTVGKGEFLVLLGPSGCGKTTLLRVMAGLEPPTAGEVSLETEGTAGASVAPIGFVFQDATLMPWRTAGGNVALPLEIQGVPRKDQTRRVKDALDLVHLSTAEGKLPNQLSGGMRQRVSIARALVHEPDVLFMDEPFGALDAQTRDSMNIELQRIWLESQRTVVFVTHSVSESVFLADRVIMMGKDPGHIHAITDIDLPRPRTVDMMEGADFRAYAGELRAQLETVQKATPKAASPVGE